MLITISLAIAAIGVSGAARMHEDFGAAMQGYQQLREVYEIAFHAAQARKLLIAGEARRIDAQREVESAITRLELALSTPSNPVTGVQSPAHALPSLMKLRGDLEHARAELDDGAQSTSLDDAISRVATIASEIRGVIEERQDAAASARRQTAWTIAAASGWLILTAAVISVRQYRAIMQPLMRLRSAVKRFAAGDLDARVSFSGDHEFFELTTAFNSMADELAGFQQELEAKVAAKSKELVRSERLASVGYLAAGVAHEINNPLGIIAAYAERALQQMRRAGDQNNASASGIKALEVISEESFRCKAITDRLLTLARPGSAERRPFSLGTLAQEVLSTLGGLPQWRHVSLILESANNDTLMAVCNDGEVKQVVLNLLVNALEAVPERRGVVKLSVARVNNNVQIVVDDNGRGIERQSLDHVFEPFYTNKRAPAGSRVGTGLGLSVCQAIIDGHGGRIFAESEGIGKGSRFHVLLPAATVVEAEDAEEVAHG